MKSEHQNTSTPKELKQRLSAAGIQASAPRMAIAQYVWNTCSHPTAEEVKTEVEKTFPTVSLATVYNTLNLFVEKGLLKEVKEPGSPGTRYDCNTKPHFHFVDESSGEIMDLDPRVLRVVPDMSLLGKNFQITDIEVTLRGRKI
ncbi:MAG: transcriptional repressor [Deltaproteobacteria bacterium]|nr:transcriptional repressor [Deltaproteobacteria bacterium]